MVDAVTRHRIFAATAIAAGAVIGGDVGYAMAGTVGRTLVGAWAGGLLVLFAAFGVVALHRMSPLVDEMANPQRQDPAGWVEPYTEAELAALDAMFDGEEVA